MEPFTIVGKAKEVFALIALKSKYEKAKEAQEALRKALAIHCPFNVYIHCSKREDKTCAEVDCGNWIEATERED